MGAYYREIKKRKKEEKINNVLSKDSYHDAYSLEKKKMMKIEKRKSREDEEKKKRHAKPYRIRLTYRCMYL